MKNILKLAAILVGAEVVYYVGYVKGIYDILTVAGPTAAREVAKKVSN